MGHRRQRPSRKLIPSRWDQHIVALEKGMIARAAGGASSVITYDNGTSPAPPPAPQGAGSAALQIYPWWDRKMPSAKDFDVGSDLFVLPANSPRVVIPGTNYRVPIGTRGVIKNLIMLVQGITTAIDVRIAILRNGAPMVGWDNNRFYPANISTEVIAFNAVDLQFDEEDLMQVAALNNNGTPWTISAEIRGWVTPKRQIDTLQGGVKY